MTTAAACRRRAIEHLVATDHARDRLARAAFEVVADGLDVGPMAVRTPADRAWVRGAIAGPIQRAAEHAIDWLVAELQDAFDGGPADLVARIVSDAPELADAEADASWGTDGRWSWAADRRAAGPGPEPALDDAAEDQEEPLVAVFR